MNHANTSQTTHSDRVAGWIVIGLFIALCLSLCLVSFMRGLPAVLSSQVVGIAQTCAGALAGSLTLRRPTAPADTQQQVTIPSSEPGVAPITVSSGNPVAPTTPVPVAQE